MGKVSQLASFVGQIFKGPEASAERQRQRVNKLLADQEELLIIVIDDIDRLQDHEIADVMRLVRLVADFPNTVYLLVFDEDRVAQAIDGDDPAKGRSYVEKIVQVSHEMPMISGEQLSQILLERINGVLKGCTYRLDQQHWSRVYLSFRRYLSTLRDVSRYCNHIRSPTRLLVSEIEAADILALEALRLFEHGFWKELPQLHNELSNVSGEANPFVSTPPPDGKQLKELVDDAQRPELLGELVQALFPAAAQHLGGSRYSADNQSTWRHQRRVADPSVLQIYLSKQLQPSEVPTPVVERVVRVLNDADALGQELQGLSSLQLGDLLGRLEDYEGNFPDDVSSAIPVLYQLTSRLPSRGGMLDIDPSMRVARVILRMLRGRDAPTVVKVVERASANLTSLGDRWSLIRLVGHIPESGHGLVSEAEAKRWEDELIKAILDATPEQLSTEPELGALLHLAASKEPDEVRKLAQTGAEHDDFLLRLISTYRHEVRSDFGRRLQLSWDRLVELLGEDLLVRRVAQLPDPPAATDEDTLELFAQARRYAAGPAVAASDLEEYRRRYPG